METTFSKQELVSILNSRTDQFHFTDSPDLVTRKADGLSIPASLDGVIATIQDSVKDGYQVDSVTNQVVNFYLESTPKLFAFIDSKKQAQTT
jgi:hypothetical protein